MYIAALYYNVCVAISWDMKYNRQLYMHGLMHAQFMQLPKKAILHAPLRTRIYMHIVYKVIINSYLYIFVYTQH